MKPESTLGEGSRKFVSFDGRTEREPSKTVTLFAAIEVETTTGSLSFDGIRSKTADVEEFDVAFSVDNEPLDLVLPDSNRVAL